MEKLDLGDRFLFWFADKFGISIDALYASVAFRAAMTLLRKASSILDRSPR